MTKVETGGSAPTIATAGRVEGDLLVRLAQGGPLEVGVAGIVPAAGE